MIEATPEKILYRSVTDIELNDILATGIYRLGNSSIEGEILF